MAIDCFPFIVYGTECKTEDEAWETFYEEAEHTFKWIRGKKIWRKVPQCFHMSFPDKDVYVVKSRIIALDEILEGMVEANIYGPYPEEKESTDMIYGF